MKTKKLKGLLINSLLSGFFAWAVINIITFFIRYSAVKNADNVKINFEYGQFYINERLVGYPFWSSFATLTIISMTVSVLLYRKSLFPNK